MRLIILITFLIGISQMAFAEAVNYHILTEQSKAGFFYHVGKNRLKGVFPRYSANISIDFENTVNSKINVILNTSTARTGFFIATQALRSKRILDATTYPDITFVSTSVEISDTNATIDGLLTVRGITKPLILNAEFIQQLESFTADRQNLHLRLTGKINRHDFGASGYPNGIGEMLTIMIDARIRKE